MKRNRVAYAAALIFWAAVALTTSVSAQQDHQEKDQEHTRYKLIAYGQKTRPISRLSLPKMLSVANTFKISDL